MRSAEMKSNSRNMPPASSRLLLRLLLRGDRPYQLMLVLAAAGVIVLVLGIGGCGFCMCLGAAATYYAIWRTKPETSPLTADASANSSASVPSQNVSRDDKLRKLVVGTWHDEYQGKRTMTLREDGTGTMVVELNGLKAVVVAKRLTFSMTWSVADGRLKKQTLSGEPAAQVAVILKTMGDTVNEPILELTESRLLVLDRDGQTKYDWRRAR